MRTRRRFSLNNDGVEVEVEMSKVLFFLADVFHDPANCGPKIDED